MLLLHGSSSLIAHMVEPRASNEPNFDCPIFRKQCEFAHNCSRQQRMICRLVATWRNFQHNCATSRVRLSSIQG